MQMYNNEQRCTKPLEKWCLLLFDLIVRFALYNFHLSAKFVPLFIPVMMSAKSAQIISLGPR